MIKLTLKTLTAVALLMLLVVGANAAELSNFYVTPAPEAGSGGTAPPGEGTSNSIFTIHFTWKETDGGKLPDANTLELCVYTPYVGYNCFTLPHLAGKGDPKSDEGRLYEFRMTAGQNLLNEGLGAGTTNPGHAIADLRDVFYIPWLKAGVNGAANTITLQVRAKYTPPDEDPTDEQLPVQETIGPASAQVIIHDSHPSSPDRDYAGVAWDRDYLYAYYQYGTQNFPYPIQSYGLNENFQWRVPDDSPHPDDGSTSTAWEFRVIYQNSDGLPPIPYMNNWGGTIGDGAIGTRVGEVDSGVVLYLRNTSWNPADDFICFPMQKVNSGNSDYAGGVEYVYYIEPQWWNSYVGMPIGEYEWFIACSDDNITTKTGNLPTYLDPAPQDPVRRAIDLPITGLTRHHHPVWMAFMDAYNSSLYLDRPTMQPGVTNSYAYPANQHPVVSIGLQNPSTLYAPENGTVEPYYLIVNPQTGATQVGGAQNQKFDFPILYQHLYGVTPESSQGAGGEISVWINNSNTITPSPTDPNTQYTRYTLVRHRDNPKGTDVKAGVLYHLNEAIQLQPGPHSFFFTASDGLKRVRYPVEGHHYEGIHGFDGPYVNHKPVLENPVVDPPTGTSGDKFRYTVIYKDADNQRPFRARVYIEYATGSIYVGEMVKENPADSDYDGVGVKYVFDTANMAQQFQVGQRRFYFEFIDDWGAPNDPRDHRQGETVYWQSAQPQSWIYGPYINRNTRPQLLDGAVNITDGANNEATLFEYKVRYMDADNQAPKFMDVYIGQKQANGTITWDSGHRMDPMDAADTVYHDGAWFRYTSRLTGGTAPAGRDYYYCFAASDQYDVAEYDPVTSPSAGAVWMTWALADPMDPNSLYPVHKGEQLSNAGGVFTLTRRGVVGDHPIVGPIPNAPTTNPYARPLAWDTTDNTIQLLSTVDYTNGTVSIGGMTSADIQYYFANPGPTHVTINNPPSLSNGRVTPDPGISTNEYTYSVVYTDPDGTMGQAPYYIRVKIDGVAYDMTRATGQANPDFRQGVTYYYKTSSLTPQLPHYYYFEASDGAGYAVFDNTGGRQSTGQPIGTVTPISGPYVNNPPTLAPPAGGAVSPVPGQPMNVGDPINFSIVYTDANNEMPAASYPVIYIRKVVQGQTPPATAPEPANDFKVVSVAGSVITASKLDDTAPGWTVNEFQGLPLQITSAGPAQMVTYRITSNTANTITVFATSIPSVGAGTTFSVGKIVLGADPTDTGGVADGLLYEYRLHSLGEGEYAVHFTSVTTETIGAGITRQTTLHYPTTGEIAGIRVVSQRLPGNQPPTLSNGAVAPPTGRTADTFSFSVKYVDPDGDPPALHGNVVGYVRLIIDNQTASPIAMTGAGSNYINPGVVFSTTVAAATLTPGAHTCYFEASDGWLPIARFPATGTLSFSVNRKPVMESPAVTPATGNAGTPFLFSVIVKDADNNRPPDGSVTLDLDGTTYPMDIDTTSGTNFVTGVRYTKTIHDPAIMTVGAHSYFFAASDGLESADVMAPIAGPTVYANTAPTLTVPMVDPVSRFTDSTYTYSVKYTDVNGDAPEYVKVFIDGTEYTMVKAVGQTDYTAGVTYTYAKQGLTAGSDHTYYFTASDHLDTARSPAAGTHTGPTVGTKPGVTLTVNAPATQPTIGMPTTLTGSIAPAMAVPITLTFTRPDGTSFTRTAASVAGTGAFSLSWTPDMTGVAPGPTWSVTASWVGNTEYNGGTSAPRLISVTGPSTTVRGLDMVSIPLDPAVTAPSVVYGEGSYALAQYRPTQNDYLYYRSSGQYNSTDLPLSDITLGGGYWMKVYDSQTLAVAPSGDLASSTASYVIHLYAGWNQIGCPFTTHVLWGNLKVRKGTEILDIGAAAARGWVRSYGWGFQQSATNPYTGEYKLVDATRNGALRYMEPWKGYWFKALVACDLLVPPPGLAMQSDPKVLSVQSVQGSGWEVQLSARVGDKSDVDNVLGCSAGSVSVESPGYFENYIDLSFIGDKGKPYAYDLRSAVKDGDAWNFKVATDQVDGLVEVAWTGVETMPAGTTLTLEDLLTGKSVQMTAGGVYTFPVSDGGRNFRVTLGSK